MDVYVALNDQLKKETCRLQSNTERKKLHSLVLELEREGGGTHSQMLSILPMKAVGVKSRHGLHRVLAWMLSSIQSPRICRYSTTTRAPK